MLTLIRKLAREPMMTGLVALAVLFIIALVISAWMEIKRNYKTLTLRERARKHHELDQQQLPQPPTPSVAPKPPPAGEKRDDGVPPWHFRHKER
jgi:hypothetical protein